MQPAPEYLWSHIQDGTGGILGILIVPLEDFSQAKVNHFDGRRGRTVKKEDVLGLQIPAMLRM